MIYIKVHTDNLEHLTEVLTENGFEYEIPNQLTFEIKYDENIDNPRDWGIYTHMFCFHKIHDLGDKHNYKPEDFNSFEEFKEQIEKDYDILEIMPLYIHDHRRITISVKEFGDPWDSGQVGWVFIEKDVVENILNGDKEKAREIIEFEVTDYNAYLNGDMLEYTIKSLDGEIIDYCKGFVNNKQCVEEMVDSTDFYYSNYGYTEEMVREEFQKAYDKFNNPSIK